MDCTLFAPDKVKRDDEVLVQIYVHAPDEKGDVARIALAFDGDTRERGYRALGLDVRQGAAISFTLESDVFEVRNPISTILWMSRTEAATFRMKVPAQSRYGKGFASVWASIDGVPVGRIDFQIEIVVGEDGSAPGQRPADIQARRFRSCFCSYSILDRVEMLKRAQGLHAAGFESFIDVMTLRPGEEWNPEILRAIEQSELFVLIWSRNAQKSQWVRKEVRHALQRTRVSGTPDFRPIPIEGPPVAPVPPNLRGIHFNDSLLLLIRAAELEAVELQRAGTRRR